ncbi:MAG TPA: NDP-sugar synthase [Actinomycetota bacterium]|nr:NDP-sugar synthase [Actinomycetota bacterium]
MATAVVLAAGRGTRLLPLTGEVPKPALPLLDVPLIVYALAPLMEIGMRVVVNVSHLGRELRSVLAGWADGGYEVLDEGPEPWGTAGTVAAVGARIDDDVLLVRNSDLLSDVAAMELLAAHERSGALATLAVAEVTSGADLVEVDGRIAFIDRRHDPGRAGLLYIGMCALSRAALDLVPDARPAGLAETVFRTLVERNALAVHKHHGYAADVGTPGRYLGACVDIIDGRIGVPVVLPGTIVDTEGGRAYIGPRAIVGTDSLGPGAVICAGATVGAGACVQRALVWPGDEVPGGTSVENAIWYRGASIPAT